ncbi:unnamed protein product [Vitrella brassicaformis CCMP3155]|uniref:Enoyl-CoA hydratase n=1 Tax=Vitrella brassicaformis (strain CCMP3155) TaxID=1169540 RepID=A0A0G4EMG6_VITBC|nr:unnamed protein product [Vitrella brassicaformis CCMP3155]|eukprot:CEL98364.1 unnamed protein product [Vitrella brassicaformis CCMP3155]
MQSNFSHHTLRRLQPLIRHTAAGSSASGSVSPHRSAVSLWQQQRFYGGKQFPKYISVDLRGRRENDKDTTAILTWDRSGYRNALSDKMFADIVQSLKRLERADDEENTDKAERASMERMKTLAGIKKPLIAAVKGTALGRGCELAFMCDAIVASDKASFGPGADSDFHLRDARRLMKTVGTRNAMRFLMRKRLTAKEAHDLQLVTSVHPTDEVVDRAESIGHDIIQARRKVHAGGMLGVFCLGPIIAYFFILEPMHNDSLFQFWRVVGERLGFANDARV